MVHLMLHGERKVVDTGEYLIWAHNGFVKLESKKDGDYRVWDPDEYLAIVRGLYAMKKSQSNDSRELNKAGVKMLAEQKDILNTLHEVVKEAKEQKKRREAMMEEQAMALHRKKAILTQSPAQGDGSTPIEVIS